MASASSRKRLFKTVRNKSALHRKTTGKSILKRLTFPSLCARTPKSHTIFFSIPYLAASFNKFHKEMFRSTNFSTLRNTFMHYTILYLLKSAHAAVLLAGDRFNLNAPHTRRFRPRFHAAGFLFRQTRHKTVAKQTQRTAFFIEIGYFCHFAAHHSGGIERRQPLFVDRRVFHKQQANLRIFAQRVNLQPSGALWKNSFSPSRTTFSATAYGVPSVAIRESVP